MRKIISFLLIGVLTLSLTACGTSKSTDTNSKSTTKEATSTKPAASKDSSTQTVDGLTLTITSAKAEAVKGDRTADNKAQSGGEYFANGSNIVKAADYKQIIVDADIKNDTDKTIQTGPFYWGAELSDGYKLQQASNSNSKSDSQVQSKGTGKCELCFVVKNDVKADKMNITYLWVKNEDEFKKLMSDPKVAQMTEQEAKEKYKDVYTGIKLTADIK